MQTFKCFFLRMSEILYIFAPVMKPFRRIIKGYTQVSLMLRIFIGLVIGASLGLLVPSWTGIGILGVMFVGALKGIAPVLVAVLVTSAIAKAGKGHGSRYAVLIGLYLLSTLIAALCAVVGSFLFPVTLQLGETSSMEVTEGSLPAVLRVLPVDRCCLSRWLVRFSVSAMMSPCKR